MLGIKVLHEDETHAGVRRQLFEQRRGGLQPACGGPDADHRVRGSRVKAADSLGSG